MGRQSFSSVPFAEAGPFQLKPGKCPQDEKGSIEADLGGWPNFLPPRFVEPRRLQPKGQFAKIVPHRNVINTLFFSAG